MADVLHSGTSITGGHADAVAGGASGFMTGADKTKLDGIAAGAQVPNSRTLTAGDGLTGGGDLSANRTFAVGATDSSVTVAADGISVASAIQTNTNLASTAMRLMLFGTGADADPNISSGTTTLTRAMCYANLTITGS